jgi:glycyl-tRNA synthetase beta chain
LPEAEALAAANKRITNILKKNAEGEIGAVVADRLVEPAEQALFAAMNACRPEIESAYAQGDFTSTLTRLAQLRAGVDQFFDKVMVMAEDQALRDNRIALLSSLHQMMNRVADISKLAA